MSEPYDLDYGYSCDWAYPCFEGNLKKIREEVDEMISDVAGVYKYCDREHEISEEERKMIEKIIEDLKEIAWID